MKGSLRIALYHNLPSGGAKRAVFEWTRRLSRSHSFDVYSLSSADHTFMDIRPFVHKYNIYEYTPRKLLKSPFGRLNQIQRWRDLGDLIIIEQRIAEAINNSAYDVVFVHPSSLTFIPTFLHLVKVKTVYYLHEPFGRKFRRIIPRPYLKTSLIKDLINNYDPLIKLYQRRLKLIQDTSVKNTKLLLANSRYTQHQIKREFGVVASVCHYGVNTKDFHPISGIKKENFLLSVGELTPRKGFDFLIESIALIPVNDRPRLKLICNYELPAEKQYLHDLATRRNVNLEINSNLSTEELAIEYNKARLCVYSPYMEPFGLVPLEAMACSTPVVAVREGGIIESVIHENTGLLVERDPAQFADAIQYLLDNPPLSIEYGVNGQDHVAQKWTWDSSVNTLESCLRE